MEDDIGPKFIKSIPKEKMFQWSPQDFMNHVEVPHSIIADTLAAPAVHYVLIWGEDGHPILPEWTTHSSITKWRKPFAEYLRFYWCRSFLAFHKRNTSTEAAVLHTGLAWGVDNNTSPEYIAIGKNPSEYIDDEFLPPGRPADFFISKTATMKKEHLIMWIKWIIKRQKKKKQGKIKTVFAWKSPKKSKKSKGKKSRGKKKAERSDGDQSSDEEVEIADALMPVNEAGSEGSKDQENENPGLDRDVSPTPSPASGNNEIELGSPASAPAQWDCRISFLRFLSNFGPYQELISMLETHQVGAISFISCLNILSSD